jgi:hypothetical protein
MPNIPGTNYNVFVTTGQTINFGVTADPNNPPPPVPGDFNLEVIVNATGTGSFNTAGGYQGLAILSSDGHTLTLLHGDYGVVDKTSGINRLFLGDGNESVGGAAGDSITGGSGNHQFVDGSLGNQSITGGDLGGETIWGGTGDTVNGGFTFPGTTIGGVPGDTIYGSSSGHSNFIDGSRGHQLIVAGSGNDNLRGSPGGTVWGGAGDMIFGSSSGGWTIAGGNCTIISLPFHGTFFGPNFIDGSSGNDSIIGGWNLVWGGAGDTISGGQLFSGQTESIGGAPFDTISGGSGDNEFIDGSRGNQSILGGTDNETIWGGPGDTITGGSSGNETIAGVSGETIGGGRQHVYRCNQRQ